MNFLSHYYFERFAADSEQVLGVLLPDLLKNVDKKYSFQIQKFQHVLAFHPKAMSITEGWNRHVEVDKLFHSSGFFYNHTHVLRKQIESVVVDLPVRASFLAHIALELLLDHLLIDMNLLKVERLYEHLEHVDRRVLTMYLKELETVDIDRFMVYYDRFVQSRYIFDYRDLKNLPYALMNICKRVWQFEATSYHIEALAERLEHYKEHDLGDFKDIYSFIQDKIE